MAIKITYYNKFEEGLCKGSFGVYIEEADLYFRGIREMQKSDGSRWFAFPSKEFTDKNGDKKYADYFYFGKEKREPFQAKLRIALMHYRKDKEAYTQQKTE